MSKESDVKSGGSCKGDEVPLMPKCFVCGAGDKNRVYLHCIHEGEEKLVCARCLPILIHGAH
ncbi:hypothetical protein JZK55_10180 [Dissulfurispira thermophila]|uniref:Uncharacterized protein n=2 Tax=root TaxID=1 RepID=A0A7G1H2B5_9BACT|nr:hypothetical protein [Dissulfurispira thermophila]BCB96096.1 hypothetical protein JZK55_10180 [Dissulfurispira thermophila]